ncbi:hypothetical protein DYB30_010065 [Aphanomyces astaci]|uniref:5'-3' exonuclease domain-containing protein n=1 Tax=Aphanomyces astaci TaxID=112090 RepID=A0A397E1R7_APHAT|nr:hypothetical protein DYB30_010065 [Aphanomyces astaci]RHY74932.1 hypothetical protein DYB38_013872 [Aphanomyces astaci]
MTRNDQAIGAAVRFVQRVREIVHAKQANRLAIMFDTPQTSQRQLANDMYKPAHRKRTMAQHLRSQFPITIDTLKALGIAVIQVPTVEADDLIASYAKACVADGFDVVIVTNDTDMYQLVQTSLSDKDKVHHSVTVYRPMARQSIREARVKKLLCGGRPAQQPEIRALCGDQRGKTPGIPGGMDIREAISLLNKHGGLVRLLRTLDDVDDKALAQRLKNSISMLELSYKESKLNDAVPLPVAPARLAIAQPLVFNRQVLERVFGADGTAVVFTAQARVRGQRPCHLQEIQKDAPPEEDCDPATEVALDQWFDSIKAK